MSSAEKPVGKDVHRPAPSAGWQQRPDSSKVPAAAGDVVLRVGLTSGKWLVPGWSSAVSADTEPERKGRRWLGVLLKDKVSPSWPQ